LVDFAAGGSGTAIANSPTATTYSTSEGEIGVFQRIVVPTDCSDSAGEAGGVAKRLSAAAGGELIVCYVLPEKMRVGPDPFADDRAVNVRAWARAALDDLVREARAKGLEARAGVRTGIAHQEIVALALDERADLIVIGTHGRGGINRTRLGSVADRVIRLAPSVRPPGKGAAA
jgi:nucleotide-binding universal stress UspA family protein